MRPFETSTRLSTPHYNTPSLVGNCTGPALTNPAPRRLPSTSPPTSHRLPFTHAQTPQHTRIHAYMHRGQQLGSGPRSSELCSTYHSDSYHGDAPGEREVLCGPLEDVPTRKDRHEDVANPGIHRTPLRPVKRVLRNLHQNMKTIVRVTVKIVMIVANTIP